MKEAIFRGQRTDTKEWIYGYLENSYTINVEIKDSDDKVIGYEKHTVIPETVSQNVGINDPNEKMIFEGDILEFESGYYDMNDPYFSWVKTIEASVVEFDKFKDLPYNRHLIGNIFDNPQLLKDYKKEYIKTDIRLL